jgi:hypothetical protein
MYIFASALAFVVSAWSCFAADIPSFWRKSMTNDPTTNWYVSQAMNPLANKDAETLRIQNLAGIIGNLCADARINKTVGESFLKYSRRPKLNANAYKEAVFLADDQFKYFDYRALVHLCAGSDYLFGPQGHLVPNLISGTKDRARFSYDPNNSYIRLASIATAKHDHFRSPIGKMPEVKNDSQSARGMTVDALSANQINRVLVLTPKNLKRERDNP